MSLANLQDMVAALFVHCLAITRPLSLRSSPVFESVCAPVYAWDTNSLNTEKFVLQKCEEVFFNQPRIILDDHKHSKEEQRYAAYGMTNDGRRLMVYFTVRETKYRVISARDMHRKEWEFYDS